MNTTVPIIRNTDIFESDADALVNPVNCEGIMGKGLARQFRERYPDMYDEYKQLCLDGELYIGVVHVYHTQSEYPRFIINIPTKIEWKKPSQLHYVRMGLFCLFEVCWDLKIKSVAVPPLGCGLGGLKWDEVYPLIKETAETIFEHSGAELYIYNPDL